MERKLYDSAKKLLEDEISFALGVSEKEIEKAIHTKLEPLGGIQKVKPVAKFDEDDEDDDLMDDIKPNKRSDDDDDEDNDDLDSDLSDDDFDNDDSF